MMNGRKHHHVLITGGAGGIGEALARCFLTEGHRVVIVDRRADALERIQQQLPAIQTTVLDITDTAALQDLASKLGPCPDGPDVLINNAGIHGSVPLIAPNYDVADQLRDIDSEIRTNFTALAQNCALWRPYLQDRAGGAAIVNIASALAFVPKYSSATYCASKAAVHQFSLSLALQLAHTRIRVVTVYPPMVATHMTAGRDRPTTMPADRFAHLFYRAFINGKRTIRIGDSRWLYWLHRLSPALAARWIEP